MAASYQVDSYVRAKALMTELIADISDNISNGERSATMIAKVADNLDAMQLGYPQGYLQLVQYITNQAGANPNDTAWQALKAEMEKVVSDFQAARTRFANMTAAINNL